jgi:hypothetical protein
MEKLILVGPKLEGCFGTAVVVMKENPLFPIGVQPADNTT